MKRVIVLGLIALVVPISASAAPFGIHVLSTVNTVTLELQPEFATHEKITTIETGSDAVGQSLEYIGPGETYAAADVMADWLSVDLFSKAKGHAFMTAIAVSEVVFAPLVDGIAEIGFDFDSTNAYTNSLVSLFDGDVEVWRYAWRAAGAPLPVLTAFDTTHTYMLHLYGRTTSQGDATKTYTRVTGLERVPEPATLLLLGTGLAVGFLKRRQLSPSSKSPRRIRSRST